MKDFDLVWPDIVPYEYKLMALDGRLMDLLPDLKIACNKEVFSFFKIESVMFIGDPIRADLVWPPNSHTYLVPFVIKKEVLNGTPTIPS